MIILCPGPSLAKLEKLDNDRRIIAVNRALLRTDLPITNWGHLDPIGNVSLKQMLAYLNLEKPPPTIVGYGAHVADKKAGFDIEYIFPQQQKDLTAQLGLTEQECKVGWYANTSLAMMAWCAVHGATEIDIYGMDLQGNEYFDDGDIKTRGGRWKHEAVRTKLAIEVIKSLGIKITRHT